LTQLRNEVADLQNRLVDVEQTARRDLATLRSDDACARDGRSDCWGISIRATERLGRH
jgi:hypothetical protein